MAQMIMDHRHRENSAEAINNCTIPAIARTCAAALKRKATPFATKFMPQRSSQPTRPPGKTAPPRTRNTIGGPSGWIAAAGLAASIACVYLPFVTVPLIFDDTDAIGRNDSIRAIWPLFGTATHPGPFNPPPNFPTAGRPLVNLSFAVNYKFGELNPVGYHAANVVIHFLSAMLLWAIVRRTLRLPYFGGRFDAAAGWLGWFTAMIWALHPLQTEAVIYATQRTELMMALFYLATLYCCLRYWSTFPLPNREGKGEGSSGPSVSSTQSAADQSTSRHCSRWLLLAFLSALCGMASKEVMVSAPLIVLLFDRAFVSGSFAAALRRSWPLYAGLASTWVLLAALSVGSPHSGAAGFALVPSVFVWWFTQAKIFWLYLKLAVWPWPLLIHYELPHVRTFGEATMYVIPLLLIGIGTLWLLWRNRPAGFLGAWYFALLAPTFVIPVVTEMAAERRMYLPLAPLVIAFVIVCYALTKAYLLGPMVDSQRTNLRSKTIYVLCAVLLLVLAGASAKRLGDYRRPPGLWNDVVRRQPENGIARQQLAKCLDDAGDTPAAVAYLREAVELMPDSWQGRSNLGIALLKTRAYDEAATQFVEAARLAPNDGRIRSTLSIALSFAGRNEEALVAQRSAIAMLPDDWTQYNNLAEVFKRLGRHQEAIEAFEQALRMNPKAIDLYDGIADNYLALRQPEQARAALQKGLELATAGGDGIKIERFSSRLREVGRN